MKSPIRTIVKNKTDRVYSNRLSASVILNLRPSGEKGDLAEFFGDIFTMIDRDSAAEMLMVSALSGNVEISYIVDSVMTIGKNTDKPNFRGSITTQAAILKANTDKVEATPAAKPAPGIEKKEGQKPVVEPIAEPAKAEPETVPAQEPVAEEDKPAEAGKEAEKPRRQRKIKEQ